MKLALLALAAINLISFALYGMDKLKVKAGAWRISEATLLLAALLGPVGAMLGMELFRHKTKHAKFKILVPLFLVLHIVVAVYIFKCGPLS